MADLAPLFALPDVAFYSLQVGPQAARADGAGALVGPAWSTSATAWATTPTRRRRSQQLDLLIAVDTSVLHLAGALGRPAWGMISARSDWRWMIDREDSPWYPTLRLFRQSRLDDWSEVFARAADVLACWSPDGDPGPRDDRPGMGGRPEHGRE